MKKKITIAGIVRSPDNCEHCYFTAELTAADVTEIMRLSALVKQNGLYSVTKFDYSATSYEYMPTSARKADVKAAEINDYISYERKPEDLPCDLRELIVTEDTFYWTWQPKHCDENCPCTTHNIRIQDAWDAFGGKGAKRKAAREGKTT